MPPRRSERCRNHRGKGREQLGSNLVTPILAVCIPIHVAGFSATAFLLQLAELAVYVPLVLFGLGALTRWLMPRVKSKEGQFLVMLLVVAIAAIGAEAIHLEGIIGAFLAGLALNRAVQESPAKHELEFLGNTLFIPMFFITVGFLIDVRVFATTLASHLGLVVGIVGGLIVSKLLAALLTRRAFGYSRYQGLVMWSLSLPQVAATLAAALVAYEAKDAAGSKADRRTGAQQRHRPDGRHIHPGADPDRAVRQETQGSRSDLRPLLERGGCSLGMTIDCSAPHRSPGCVSSRGPVTGPKDSRKSYYLYRQPDEPIDHRGCAVWHGRRRPHSLRGRDDADFGSR